MLRESGRNRAKHSRLARRSLEVIREVRGTSHPYSAGPLLVYGSVLVDRGEAREAAPLLLEAVRIRREVRGDDDWQTAISESILGSCLSALGRFDEAEPLLKKSYSLLREHRGARDPETRRALDRLRALR
jgi:hypothetical protein